MTVMVAPPLAPSIARELNLGQAATGALTTFPILMLAVAGIAASWLISRIGARYTLILALVLVAASSSARGLGGVAPLFTATAIMGIAIAGIQPALPTLLTEWMPERIAFGTAVYMNGMLMGEVLGSTLTLPMMLPLAGGEWRLALLFWSLPAVIPALGLLFLLRNAPTGSNDAGSWMPAWRKPLVWRLGMLLGASGSLFFGTNAYLGTVLNGRGDSELLGLGLILLNGTQLIASVSMFWLTRHWIGRARPLFSLMALGLASLGIFVLVPGLPGLFALAPAGITAGMMLILMVGLPPLYARGNQTAALAAGMFAIGSITNFLIPLLGGLVADFTGMPGMAVIPIVLYCLAVLPLARNLPPVTQN
jgi:CP family cyanate transporter-like MFS transporter